MIMRYLPLLVIGVLWLVACKEEGEITPPVMDDRPVITAITPAGLPLGRQQATGRIHGANFIGQLTIDFGPGITVQLVELEGPSVIVVRISVSDTAQPGFRQVSVTSPAGRSNPFSFEVINNRVPVPQFSLTPAAGHQQTIFTFNATTSSDPDGTINTYEWDFGDGTSGTGPVVTHQYTRTGNFTVVLTVTDNRGGIARLSREVSVRDLTPPVAQFTISPSTGNTTTLFAFDASSSVDTDGQIVSYAWNFGDTVKTGGITTSHRYALPGNYTVRLTITDNDGHEVKLEKPLQVQ